jgi:hypothetical protein
VAAVIFLYTFTTGQLAYEQQQEQQQQQEQAKKTKDDESTSPAAVPHVPDSTNDGNHHNNNNNGGVWFMKQRIGNAFLLLYHKAIGDENIASYNQESSVLFSLTLVGRTNKAYGHYIIVDPVEWMNVTKL